MNTCTVRLSLESRELTAQTINESVQMQKSRKYIHLYVSGTHGGYSG